MTRFEHAPGTIARHVADRVIVLPRDLPMPLELSATGARVWDAVGNGGATRTQIVDELAQRFTVEPSVLAADIAPFLDHLVASGALVRVS